tara:strand:- start:4190 stop:5377 length:1188 start_codon:yes stop_codon:yes gene_type:complete
MNLPLKGIKVLDLSRLAAGNMVSHMLADYGADVIKIEKPGKGDDLRHWKVKNISHWWHVYSRNKRSIALDFKSDAGIKVLKNLIKKSDIFIENFVPGTLEKWGLAPKKLLKINQDLIVLRISGWGQTGIYKNQPGFGSLVEGMSGFAAMTGEKDQVPILPPTALADMISGLSGFSSLLLSLFAKQNNKVKGQVIDLSLFEPLFSIIGPWAAYYKLTGKIPEKMGNKSPVSAPRNIYKTKDEKYVSLSASMQSMWEKLASLIKREDLITNKMYLTNEDRIRNQDKLDRIIADFMIKHKRDKLLETFSKHGVTIGPVLDISELIDHPYIKDRGILVNLKTKSDGEIPMHEVFPRLSKSKGSIRTEAPKLGQHTKKILKEIGYNKIEIQKFFEQKIVE